MYSDPGIFIIGKAQEQTNTSLNIGDRLLEISSTVCRRHSNYLEDVLILQENTYDLRFVTFDEARRLIRLACAESQTVKISVAHATDVVDMCV